MKLERLHISIFLAMAVLLWGLVLLVQGTVVGWDHLRPFSTVVGFLGAGGLAFNLLLWRHPWIHGWFVKRPDLRGTWRVELQSDWIDPATQARPPSIICYMGVVQTLSILKMHLMTPESESWCIAESVTPSPNGLGYRVAGVYTNKPKAQLRGDRSEIHLGGMVLDSHGPPNRPDILTGEYWTDRKTKGQMTFTGRQATVLTRFEDAEQAFNLDRIGTESGNLD